MDLNLGKESTEDCKPSSSNIELEDHVFKRPLSACPKSIREKYRQRMASKSSIKIVYEENLSTPAPKQPINVCLVPKGGPKMVATKSDDPLPSFLYEENPDDFGEQMARYLEVNVENPNSYSKDELKRLRRRVRNRMSAKKARLESKRRIMKLRRERKDLKAELMKSAGEIEEKIVARYGNYDIYKQRLAKFKFLKALSNYYKSAKFFTIPPFSAFLKLKGHRKQKK